jgi:hypothetical protein
MRSPAARVVARKPSGEEFVPETAELSRLEGQGMLLSPKELGTIAKRLARASQPREAAYFRELLTRRFYGI